MIDNLGFFVLTFQFLTLKVTLEWIASPCNDMFADAVLSAVLQVVTSWIKLWFWLKAFLGGKFGQSEVPAPSYKSWQTAFQRMSHRTSTGGFFIHWSSFKSHTDYPQDMFGEESVPKIFSGDRITVSVDTRKAVIDVASLEVSQPTLFK